MPIDPRTERSLEEEIASAARAVEDARRVAYRDPSRLGDLVEKINYLAELRVQSGDYPRAERLYREVLYTIDDTRNSPQNLKAGITSLLAWFYDRWGKTDKAIEFYEKSLDLATSEGTEEDANLEQIGTICNNLGMIHKRSRRLDESEFCYKQALEAFTELYGDDHPRVASVLNNLGVLYYSRLDTDRAMEMHEKALKIRKVHCNGSPYSPDLGQSWFNLGAVHKARGQMEQANECIAKAEAYRRPLKDSKSDAHRQVARLAEDSNRG